MKRNILSKKQNDRNYPAPAPEEILGKVSEIVRLKNLNILILFDGEKELEIVDFKDLCKNITSDDFVKAIVVPEKNKESFKLIRIEKLNENNSFIDKFSTKINDIAKPTNNNFIVKSDIYEKLRPLFNQAIEEIKKAVFERRPILIRHHFDCDGYSGAIAVEKAINSLALKINRNQQSIRTFLKRIPCTLPFYDLDEAVSDISSFLEKPVEKEPLLILIDNGSTSEDLLGLRKLQIYDFKVIVIDHHVPAIKDNAFEVDSLAKVHINPYKVNGDSNITAGMLGCELANMINPDIENLDCLAALSGVADRSSSKEFEQYLSLAQSKNCDIIFLEKLSKVIDYLTSSIRKKESKTFIENLFDFNNKIQKRTVDLIYPELVEMERTRLNTIKKFLEVSEKNNTIIARFNFESMIKRGTYPPTGKSTGLIIDELKKDHNKVAVIAYSDESMVVRTSGIEKDINEFISEMKDKKPYTNIEGGGHKNAASIRFIKKVKEEVMNDLIEWLTQND